MTEGSKIRLPGKAGLAVKLREFSRPWQYISGRTETAAHRLGIIDLEQRIFKLY
jgi:hypothetical protein